MKKSTGVSLVVPTSRFVRGQRALWKGDPADDGSQLVLSPDFANQAICPYIRLTTLGMMMTKRTAATTRI